jgi:hypothetical protein
MISAPLRFGKYPYITAGDSNETRPEPVESPGLENMPICSLK